MPTYHLHALIGPEQVYCCVCFEALDDSEALRWAMLVERDGPAVLASDWMKVCCFASGGEVIGVYHNVEDGSHPFVKPNSSTSV
jgi:hypothetical protein